MSLKVWLPLDGSLENKGEETVDVITNGTIVYSDGKIGANAVDTTNGCVAIPLDFINEEMSICFWIYDNNSGNWRSAFSIGEQTSTDSNRLEITYAVDDIGTKPYTWYGFDDVSKDLIKNRSIMTYVKKMEWAHITITIDGLKVKCYKNGVFASEFNQLNTLSSILETNKILKIGSRMNNNGRLEGFFNDFRIYDHALSDKEVKEISKGLIAHYKLDNSSPIGIEKDVSGYGHDGVKNGDLTYSADSARYVRCTKFNGNNTIIINDTISSHSIESISLWLYVNETQKTECIFMGGNSNLSLCISSNKIITSCEYTLPKYMYNITDIKINDWNHIVIIKNEEYDILYVNGKEQSDNLLTIKDYYGKATSHINIGGREITSSQSLNPYYTNKNVSDVRIYATALSEEDVKELYETSAIIDDKGNLFAYDFVEGENTDIGANGIITTPQLVENDILDQTKGQIYNNKIIVNQFIEL